MFKQIIKYLIIFIFCIVYNSQKIYCQENTLVYQEIMHQAIRAYGGDKTLREQENKNYSRTDASFYTPQGKFFGTYTYYFKKPDKIHEEFYNLLQDVSTIRIYNAGKVFITQNGKKVSDEAQLENFKRNAQLRSKMGIFYLLYLLDHSNECIYIGEELINGRKCFGLELHLDKDIKDTYFFDAETFFVLKSVITISDTKGNTEITRYYYDFQKVEGVNFPFRIEVYQDGSKISEMIVRKISFEELADSLFEIP